MTRPNILILMADQWTGRLFPDGPVPWLHLPNLNRLAEGSARFQRAYTPAPLCTPARAGFMTGRLPSRIGVYDNASAFGADVPTFAHHLRRAGYWTGLAGKMHFVGPDQLHGFEERLTTDIYPADFGWTPDYRNPGERIDWWYHSMGSVTGAGIAEITNQLEFDDDVAHRARQKLYDLARGTDERPWCLTVSFTHPHDPYVARQAYWDLYADCAHLLPDTPAFAYEDHDPHSQRILEANDWQAFEIGEADIKRARRAYFANLSYLDAQIGALLETLEATGQEAAVVFTADHGDMLGERGLWFKMSFLEGSARVPLMIAAPGLPAGRVDQPVSLMDVAPSLCEIAGIAGGDHATWMEGESLLATATGAKRETPVAMEYAAEASYAPLAAIVSEGWKYIRCPLDPEQLFDLTADPEETVNRAGDPAAGDRLSALRGLADQRWDMEAFDAAVRDSQARRHVIYEAARQGRYQPWDYEPRENAAERYMRNHMDLNEVEARQRFPREE